MLLRSFFCLCFYLFSLGSTGQQLLAEWGFEEGDPPTRSYSLSTPPCEQSGDLWQVKQALDSLLPFEGERFWAIRDLNGNCGGTGFEWIEFPETQVASFKEVVLEFRLNVDGFDNGDEVQLELVYDGIPQDRMELVRGENDYSTKGWQRFERPIPEGVSNLKFRIYVKQNGPDQMGLDAVKVLGKTHLPCTDLLISEYYEGSSSKTHRNSFLELYNASDQSLDLSAYSLVKYTQGDPSSKSSLSLEGSLGAHQTYLIEDETENLGINSDLSTNNRVMDFNGDDVIALFKGDELLDQLGYLGIDADFAKDLILRRKSWVEKGNLAYTPSAWERLGLDQRSDLGKHQSSCQGPIPEISVFGKGQEIKQGEWQTRKSNGTYLGMLRPGDPSSLRTNFVVRNDGTGLLSLDSIYLEGAHGSAFRLEGGQKQQLGSGEELELQVRFLGGEEALYEVSLNLLSNDASEALFSFRIQAEQRQKTESPLQLTGYYEGASNDRWIEVSNLGNGKTSEGDYYLALFRSDLLDGPLDTKPSVQRILPAMEPGESLLFRSSLTVSKPEYALALPSTRSNLCTFSGDDVLVVSRSGDEQCWAQRLDQIGSDQIVLEEVYLFRKSSCATKDSYNDYVSELWEELPLDLAELVLPKTNALLGFHREQLKIFSDGKWMEGAPSEVDQVLIHSNYDSGLHGDLHCCAASIAANTEAFFREGSQIFVKKRLDVEGRLAFEAGASLLTGGDQLPIEINGKVDLYGKTSPLKALDYTYWSSPIDSASLEEVFALNPIGHYYAYGFEPDTNPSGQEETWIWKRSKGLMLPGRGYAIPAPKEFVQGETQEVLFSGTPNDAVLEVPIQYSDASGPEKNWVLLGNPYPSGLNLRSFFDHSQNKHLVHGSAYLWTHNTAFDPQKENGEGYQASDYAIFSIGSGGVQAQSGGKIPGEILAAMQGFFVNSKAQGQLLFENSMRRPYQQEHFFKRPEKAPSKRIWLNLRQGEEGFSQVLICFAQGATRGFDSAYDAYRFGQGETKLFSPMGEAQLAIRGENIEDLQKSIPLGFKQNRKKGNCSISLAAMEGLKAHEYVYLIDWQLGKCHRLDEGEYRFTSNQVEDPERFTLRVSEGPLKNPFGLTQEEQLLVFEEAGNIIVRLSSGSALQQIVVYDLLGRKVFSEAMVKPEVTIRNDRLTPNSLYFVQAQSVKDQCHRLKYVDLNLTD